LISGYLLSKLIQDDESVGIGHLPYFYPGHIPIRITPWSDTATQRASEIAKNNIAKRSCSLR